MAIKPLKTIKFPELPDTYTVPQVDTIPTQSSTNAVSSGGVYESINDLKSDLDAIEYDLYNDHTKNLFDEKSETLHLAIGTSSLETSNIIYGFYVPVDPSINTTVTIKRDNVGTRFRSVATTTIPGIGTTYDSSKRVYSDTGTRITYTLGDEDKYIYVLYYNVEQDTITEEQALEGFKIFYGTTYVEKKSNIVALEEVVNTLSSDVEGLQNNVEDIYGDLQGLEQSIGTLPDDVEDIQVELGIKRTYSIPSGYQSANYSNQAGTMQFKYENDKLILKKTNSAGELTTSNASLTIDSTLGVAVEANTSIKFEYDNGDATGNNVIRGRLYKSNYSNSINMNVGIPAGQGTAIVNLYNLAEELEKDIVTYPVFVIYGIKIETGASVSGATVWIEGFTTTEALKETVTRLQSKTTTLESEIAQIETELDEIIEDIGSGVKLGENLYEKRYEDLGYPNYQTGAIDLYSAEYIEMTSAFIPVVEGDVITVQEWVKDTPKSRIAYYDSNRGFLSYDNMPSGSYVLEGSIYHVKFSKTIASGVAYIKVGYGSYGDGKIMVTKNSIPSGWLPAAVDMGTRLYNVADSYNLRGFAHCGKKELAPENTVKSFMLAAQEGYTMVETDVRFTSDNVPVLLHDATINRTARNADGTELSSDVYIHEITYAQAYEYDFGIWKGSEFAGTKIMRFDDFIVLCKRLNLYPAIEIKNDENHITESQVHIMVDIVNEHQMISRCHFQSYQLKCLTWVKKYEPRAWLGMSASSSAESPISEKRCIELKYFLKTQFNDTFISAKDDIPENIAIIKKYGVQLYTFAEESEYMNLNPLVIGVISDGAPYPAYVREHILDGLTQ